MEAEQAKIMTCIDDQGGGVSWCSACDATVLITDKVCPACKRGLTFGEISFTVGGSDF